MVMSAPCAEATLACEAEGNLGLAIDLGTTTIVGALSDGDGVHYWAEQAMLNSQKRYGSDVISRLRAATLGKGESLRQTAQDDLCSLIRLILERAEESPGKIGSLCISANTAMVHLLLGLPVDELAVAPFTPHQTDFPVMEASAVLGAQNPLAASCPVRLVPAISAFAGGDLVAGIAVVESASTMNAPLAPWLIVDLGTNAEIALVTDTRIYASSASAGPAFEGGRISCGTGGIPGAVSSVRIEGSRFTYTTITREGMAVKPVGICGSGILDLTACALDTGLIEENGSLVPVCEQTGIVLDAQTGLRLTSADVREIQLAKAAIRAGVETLIHEAGITEEAISTVYVAGAFGRYLQELSAIRTGLLPATFAGKIRAAGNTSLAGAVLALAGPGTSGDMDTDTLFSRIVDRAQVVQLADSPVFAERFIASMNF